jgi:hypothetical protein
MPELSPTFFRCMTNFILPLLPFLAFPDGPILRPMQDKLMSSDQKELEVMSAGTFALPEI